MSDAMTYVPAVIAALIAIAMVIFLVRLHRRTAGSQTGRPWWLHVGVVLAVAPTMYACLLWGGWLSDTYLRVARPWGLGVTALAVAFVAWRLPDQPGRPTRLRKGLGDTLAVIAALLAGWSMAGLEIGRPLDRMTVLVAIDRSRSIEMVPEAEVRIERELTAAEVSMRPDDRIGTIAFGADAAVEDPPRPQSELPAPQRVEIGRDGTDLGGALRRALAEVPADASTRIILLSDGVATRGDALGAAAAAVAAQVPVDVVPLEQRKAPDVRVVSVRAPPRIDAGEAFDLRVVTSAPKNTPVEVRVKRDGKLISKAEIELSAGEDVLRVREKAPDAGMHRYDVEVTAKDASVDATAEDNTGSSFVRVRGEAAALVLEGEPGKGAFIAKSLEHAAFRVAEGGLASIPTDLGTMAAYDLVVLSDIPAFKLSPAQIDMFAAYVRDLGGGLILMGGPQSMGPGGYGKTPIEEVSPVSFDIKQEKRRASLAEVIGIDISGSMAAEVSGKTKLELANEAAARSAQLLGSADQLGVAHVDTMVKWSVPLQPLTDKDAVEKAIRAVQPGGGGILCDITMQEAYAALDKSTVNLKHVLLFADGSDAENLPPAITMTEAAFRRGITTSVVALGKGVDVTELERMSTLGGGRFYLIEDATRLPTVFAQETVLAARSAIVEEDFSVAVSSHAGPLAGIDFGSAPDLKGYIVTIPKSRARVLLTGLDGDPILSTWSVGIGRSAAFTSDLKDRWGARWTQWPGAARLVGQMARDVARQAEDERVRLQSDARGGQLRVQANVVGDDGRAKSFRRLVVHVAGPDGFSRDVALEAVGAGAYAATIPLSRPGTYITVAKDEVSGDAVGTTGAVLTAGEEMRPTGSDIALLTRIADLTGGKRRDTLAGLFADRGEPRFAYEDWTSIFMVAAAAALLLMVAARRLSFPETWTLKRLRVARAGAGAATAATAAAPTAAGPVAWAKKRRAKDEAAPQVGAMPPTVVRRAPPAASPVVKPAVVRRAPPGAPTAAPRPPPTAGAPVVRAARPPAARPQAGSGQGPPSSRRPMTAAEILLAKRKKKGR